MPEFFNRPPRIQPELPTGEIQIPAPPSPMQRQSLIQIGVPLITIAGYILVSTSGKSGNVLFVLPMALAVAATTIVSLITFRRNNRIEADNKAAYARKLQDLRNELLTLQDKQRAFYEFSNPDPQSAMQLAGNDEGRAMESRLWERRSSDDDFGTLRLGIGTMPSTVEFKVANSGSDNAPDSQLKDAEKLLEDSRFVHDVPIAIPLRDHFSESGRDTDISARHAIGIAGQDRASVTNFVRAMLVNFAAFHAPTDARLFVVGSPDARGSWDWARWLPHANESRGESSAGSQLYFEPRKVRQMWDSLQAELERRQLRLADKSSGVDVTVPFLLVVIDALTPKHGESPLKDVEAEAAVATLLQKGPRLGAAIVFLVPDYNDVPSECRAVIEIGNIGSAENDISFRYAEVGVNTPRYDGKADSVEARAAESFARRLAPLAVRTTYGADLAQAVSMLELFHAHSVDQLPILDNWRDSRKPDKADWLHVPIGLLVGNKVRDIVFSADGDGVHGLAAGTTGSGKSELLLTIVMGLAVEYDPSVINLVLVDYKGGTAFEPLRKLPHVVDIVTNLQGMAGARTFTALRAELNRRSKILADTNTKHIVHYRSRNLHVTHEPFPFLFVIIDEFAEMIKEMPEFKVQLDSIARLGRALGVHLLLATQRPSGVVSDQIRANMKFRICLRVETPEDSRELLRRSDAAFLPPNIPGRAYLQVGNENVELMQVARAGGPYTGSQETSDSPPVMWLSRHIEGTMMEKNKPRANVDAQALSDVIVSISARLAGENEDVKPQKKPWPDPLPTHLYLDSEYLGAEANPLLPLNSTLIEWLEGRNIWPGVDWTDSAMKASIGLIDNPSQAEQLKLTLDLTRGHAVIFGASGWGKTGLLRTLMMSLAATHSPEELNIYVLDFGGRGLDLLQVLPHVGATIFPAEDERVQRLLRKLSAMLEERKTTLSQARADNLIVYNANHPDSVVPAVLVVLDNFAGFRENYEGLMDVLISLVRDGRSYGIHFAVTAEQPNAIPGKLFSLFTERLALKLADVSEYGGIVGRGVPGIDDIAGRGFVAVDRRPLEFQTALPVSVTPNEEAAGLDDAKKLVMLAQTMNDAWNGPRPENIDTLRPIIPLRSVLPETAPKKIAAVLGLEDLDLKPAVLDLQAKGPHFILIGPPLSGKTTTLRSWVLSLAQIYSPDRVAMVLIDFQQRFFKYGGKHTLADLPHVLTAISELSDLTQMIANLKAEYETPHDGTLREIFIFADNYDDFANAIGNPTMTKNTAYKDMGDMARKFGPEGLHFIVGGSPNALRANDDLLKQVLAPRFGLGLDASEAASALGGRVRAAAVEFPPGRGYVVKSGRVSLIQVATPQNDTNVEESLDAWVDEIIELYPDRAQWTNPEPVVGDGAAKPVTQPTA